MMASAVQTTTSARGKRPRNTVPLAPQASKVAKPLGSLPAYLIISQALCSYELVLCVKKI